MAESNLYSPLNDPAINPFRRTSSANADIIKRFVTPQSSVSGGGNGVTSLDDPTYLGFSLRFDITSPLFNGSTVGDPFNESPNIPAGESALGYLVQVGQKQRAQYLRAFVQGLFEVNNTRPYYWQTIEGLSNFEKHLPYSKKGHPYWVVLCQRPYLFQLHLIQLLLI